MTIDWFRKPILDGRVEGEGTLNACYNALDRHVVRGAAEDVAVVLAGRDWTYADLLSEVGAFAGVLRAFGVGLGDAVVVAPLPALEEVVASLAVARLGAVRWYAEASTDDVSEIVEVAGPHVVVLPTRVPLDLGDIPVITIDDTSELSWTTVMRAGRTDPAQCADVPASGVLAVVAGRPISMLTALGARDDPEMPLPTGARPIDVGGLTLWSFDTAEHHP